MSANTGTAIVQMAYEDAGKCSVGTTISAAQASRGFDRMMDIVNLWATQGLKVWLQQDIAIPLTAGQTTYVLGPGGDVNMPRPLQTLQGYYLSSPSTSQSQQPLVMISRDEYTRLIQPSVTGAISSFFPDKQATFLAISMWNTPDVEAAAGVVHVICRVSIPNTSTITDQTAFPQEWVIALRWALADEVSVGMPKEVQDRCSQRAGAYRTALEDFDVEDAPTRFVINPRGYGAGNRFH